MKRWQATSLGAIGLAALVTSGCGHFDVTTREQSYQVSDAVDRLVIHEDAGAVKITVGDGPIRVTETLRYSAKPPNTQHKVSNGTLALTDLGCSRGHFNRCEVRYEVRVPARTAVEVDTDAGQVSATGLAGDFKVVTDAGVVRGTELSSQHTSVQSDAGAIELSYVGVPSTVDARTDAGAIEIHLPGRASYAVAATTDAGKTTISVPADAGSSHKITAHTDAGAIEVRPA